MQIYGIPNIEAQLCANAVIRICNVGNKINNTL